MARVGRGDARAFELLFERFRPRLFGFLARRCGDPAAAEDLLQETWIRVLRARARFDPGRRFSTWLFQIANNLCRDRARRREVEHRTREGMTLVLEMDPPGPGTARPEARLDVERRLATLPDRLREVIVLRYLQELPEREIAEIAGIPQGTVKSRLHAAVRALREAAAGETRREAATGEPRRAAEPVEADAT